MSLFLGQASQYSQVRVDPEKIKLADIQFQAMSYTFNKLLVRCEQKCLVHEYGEGELSKGESECIDRCVTKYVKANLIIGEHFQKQRIDAFNTMPEYIKIKEIIGSGDSGKI
ncbi:TIM12 [Candida jiufengensis]|uniref:TIM12 n=1 Tax=Candida jiufengensis TaxID=497108 RepID=UPI00222557E8|nr:TIM12 [Candida jiufengensis]KAI5949860.1 TIM12 [Candida jiufengensis]